MEEKKVGRRGQTGQESARPKVVGLLRRRRAGAGVTDGSF